MLNRRQKRFIEQFVIDLVGTKAAIRAGYSPRSAEVTASRLLRNAKVQTALRAAMQARSRRTEIRADRVIEEFATIAFANMRDYWPKEGETLDLHRLDQDRTAAVEELTISEKVGTDGVLRRRTHVKLADKLAALTSLARHLGMFADRRLVAGSSIEQRIVSMRPEERVAYANELLEGAPLHEKGERRRNRKDEAEPRPIDQK